MNLRKLDVYADGIKSKSTKWHGVFVDHAGVLRRLPLSRDRKASDELARTVDRLNSLKSAGTGDVLPPELSRAVEQMPTAMRKSLANWRIISPEKSAASKPLLQHVDDWKAALIAKGNTPAYARQSDYRVRRVIVGCGFVTLGNVSASKVQRFIADLRNDWKTTTGKVTRGISDASSNYYLRDCRSFFRWMERDGRCHENPIAHLQGTKATETRHNRRALSPDELRWLLDTANTAAGERNGMSGPERSMLYRLAAETGLRAGELRSLTRASFNLGEDPAVTIDAAYAKNRRKDTLPLRAETAALLADHLAGKLPAALAFNLPRKDHIVTMFRDDMADARAAWIASHQLEQDRQKASESTFLSSVDDAGLFADFHGLRHTFISNLASGGVHPKTAQRLARHSTITLTMDRYTHLRKDDMADALDSLPDLSAPQQQIQRATGTADIGPKKMSPRMSPTSGIQWNAAHSGAQKAASVEHAGFPGRIDENTAFTAVKSSHLGVAESADATDLKSVG
jgi:integrase